MSLAYFTSPGKSRSPKMKRFRFIHFIKRRYCIIIFAFSLISIIHFSGLLLYLSQCDLDSHDNKHPMNWPNLTSTVNFYHQRFTSFSALEELKQEANRNFDVQTLDNHFDERFLIENQKKCQNLTGQHEDIRLLVLVKSALSNRKQRDLLRKSWANERRFADVKIRTLFSIGSCDGVDEQTRVKLDINRTNHDCQDLIDEENEMNGDLIQIDFNDSYFNNTIKTLNGIKWAVKNCANVQFVLLIDDDYYLSIKNLLKHIRWLNFSDDERERVIKQMNYMKTEYERSSIMKRFKPKFDSYTQNLISGYVFNSSTPCRYRFSKWFIDLDEYPFSKWPRYVTAGFVLLSNRSLKSIYFASLYTHKFRFDDIYLSILSRKINVHPEHMQDVHFYKFPYTRDLEYRNVIGSHGFGDGNEMIELWMLMKSKGYA